MPPYEIRKEAREALKGNWGKGVLIILAYFLFTLVTSLLERIFEDYSLIFNLLEIVIFIITIPISFGLTISFIKLKRNEKVSAFGFFKDGFSRFGKSWGISFRILLRLLLPFLCLFLIFILMGVLIFYKATTINYYIAIIIFSIIIYIASIVYIVSRTLLYTLSFYISYDNPELSSKDCVVKSETYMKGNRGNFFLLQLSFIGWAILACLTFGIGFLWLLPYAQVAIVCFYERVLKSKTQNNDEAMKVNE